MGLSLLLLQVQLLGMQQTLCKEFFCVFLVQGLGLVLILVPAGRRSAASVFDSSLSVIVVVLVLLVVLDGAVVAVAGTKVDFCAATASLSVVDIVVVVQIAWNATNAFV